MDIEKLIERLRGYCQEWEAYRRDQYRHDLEDTAAALSTLQAENEKLRAELEQVKRERDAAIGDIEEILAEIEQIRTSVEEPDVGEDWALSAICQKYCDRGGDHCWKDAGLGRCGNFRWKKPEKDESTCHDGVCDIPGAIAQDEATEFTRGQWDWLMGRFTRKED